MKKLILSLIANGISLYVADYFVQNMEIQNEAALIMAAVIFGIANGIVKPVLKVLTFPITFLTFGLFALVINGIILKFTAYITPSFELEGLLPAVGAAIIISVVNSILHNLLD